MVEARNQQIETTVQMDAEQTEAAETEDLDPGCVIEDGDSDSASESYKSCCSGGDTGTASESYKSCCSGDGTDTMPRVAGILTDEMEEFIPGLRRYAKNILDEELSADTEEWFRQALPLWNTFLQSEQGIRGTSAIISSDINEDINKYIRGEQCPEDSKKWIKSWLPRWNMYLQARAGETLMTRWNVCLTIVGFILYIVDLGSDIGTSIYYASYGQWWQAIITLTLVYGAVIIHTIEKWRTKEIHCTCAADWLRYVASLLVNWPDVKQYGALCLLEWKLHKSSVSSAHLVPERHQRRLSVAYLKFMEGVCEACPQAILQLCLLIPDLYKDWRWTDYIRIAGASVSLCTAGAALVNWEKFDRINNYNDLPLSELVLLHVWAVPVTMSRLLSVALLLSVHPYWALVCVALHLVLYGVDWCRTVGGPRTLVAMCLDTLQFFMSPFFVDVSATHRRVYHVIHFLGNTAVTVVWALGTPLVCRHPALYTAIICFNAVMFAVGLLGWQLHQNSWRR